MVVSQHYLATDAGHFILADGGNAYDASIAVAFALAVLQQTYGVVHNDLHTENVLFKTKDPESQIKVIDFGLSAIYSDRDNLHARVGTVFYMSPEVRSSSVEFENMFL